MTLVNIIAQYTVNNNLIEFKMGLSSNSIIHFTKNISSLNGILSEYFKIKYCREKIVTLKQNYDFLVPEVSFCDIPFSQILNHINSYGSYGIGLKKSWAVTMGLNPVLYVEKQSNLTNHLIFNLITKIANGRKKQDELEIEEKYILDIIRYIKNYEGDLERIGKKTIKNYRFSDEREWRYVPVPKKDQLLFGNLTKAQTDNIDIKNIKEKLNKELENERLKFQLDDISYIIINKEIERDIVIRNLEMKNRKFPLEQVKRLTSRILTVEQIKTDF